MYQVILNGAHRDDKTEKAVDTVKAVFDEAGISHEFHVTERKGHAKEIAHDVTESGEHTTIIVMGGDGTLHEALNGICYPDRCDLGLIPIGTGNDFAAAVNIPDDDVRRAAEIIASGEPRKMDYIQLSSGLRSINIVGMGVDVEVMKRTSEKNHTKMGYQMASIGAILTFKGYRYTAEVDGVKSEHYGLLTSIGNGRQEGGNIKLFPDYSVDDGWMEFLMADHVSPVRALIIFLSMMSGKLKPSKKVHLMRAKKIKIECENPDFTIQAEGELYDNMPLETEIVHDVLSFYRP